MIEDSFINPFGNRPEEERPFTPVSVPNWTEHYAFFAYDDNARAGAFIHIGRVPSDPAIWRGTIQIFLPNGELLAGKYFGRDGSPSGAGAGPLRVTCIEPFRVFTAQFDGMLQRVTREAITSKLLSDGPSERARLSVMFEARGPLLGKALDTAGGRTDGSFHTEQIGRAVGDIHYEDKRIALNGFGTRDHSCGPRDYGPVVSHLWIHGLFDDGKGVSCTIYRTTTTPEFKRFYLTHAEGRVEECEILEHPYLVSLGERSRIGRDPASCPDHRKFALTFRSASGVHVLNGEVRTTHAITYVSPCEELVGTDFNNPDGIQMCDAPAVLQLDGVKGIGLFERSARISMLK